LGSVTAEYRNRRLLRASNMWHDEETTRNTADERSPIHHCLAPKTIESAAILRRQGGFARLGDHRCWSATINRRLQWSAMGYDRSWPQAESVTGRDLLRPKCALM